MANNRTFFKNVQQGKLSLGDIFSEVTRKHTPEQAADVFIAGTPKTTPREADMLAGWQKPYLFFRFLCGGILVTLMLYLLVNLLGHTPGYIFMTILIPTIVNLTWLLLAWELNVPRNISLYDLLKIVMVGGVLSLLAAITLFNNTTNIKVVYAGLVEEPAKLLVVYLVLKRKDYRYMLNGILVGVAVGTGYAIFEDLQYAMLNLIEYIGGNFISYYNKFVVGNNVDVSAAIGLLLNDGMKEGLLVAIVRAATSVMGHGLYAGLYGGALALAKGKDKLSLRHLLNPQFLVCFCISVGLHGLNNYGLDLGLPVLFDLLPSEYVLIQVIGVAVFLPYLRKGVNQIVEITAAENGGRVTMAVNRGEAPAYRAGGWCLEAVAGPCVGQRFPLSDGQSLTLGRKSQGNDISLPGCANVSGTHCRITATAAGITVTDLNSTNGTFLGDRRLAPNQPTPVEPGCMIYLGNKSCGFCVRS